MHHKSSVTFCCDEVISIKFSVKGMLITKFILVPPDGPVMYFLFFNLTTFFILFARFFSILSCMDALVYPLAASPSLGNLSIMPHEPGVTFCLDEGICFFFSFIGTSIALFIPVPPNGPVVILIMASFLWLDGSFPFSFSDALINPLAASPSLRNFTIMHHKSSVPRCIIEVSICFFFSFIDTFMAFFIFHIPDGPVLIIGMINFLSDGRFPHVNFSYFDALIDPLITSPSLRNFIIMPHEPGVPLSLDEVICI